MKAGINARVKAQYEAFPYPNYGLFLPLRTQEAYASHSLFAARLLGQHGQMPAVRRMAAPGVLLAGCGDTFPYLAAAWEPRAHELTAVDLSARNLRRARLRCLPRLRGITWRQGNLEDPDFDLPEGLCHIDSYGVLHHLANPASVLRRFGERLLPGGTARIMVYNSEARGWIRHVQKAFALLGLSALRRGDAARGKKLLEDLAAVSPALRERFAPMRGGAFANASSFVDTFLHEREARLDLPFWLRAIEGSGLRVIGLYDRYGELDDLPNPLLEAPQAGAWGERIADRRFENNFELYLAKFDPADSGPAGSGPAGHGDAAAGRKPSAWRFLKSPPNAWFEYPETGALPWLARARLWSHFLRGLERSPAGVPRRRDALSADSWAGSLPPAALQRLGRLGALFPDDFQSPELRELLRRPLHETMEPPEFAAPVSLSDQRGLRAEAESILKGNNRPLGHLDLVMKRLEAAQKP